MFNVLIEDLDTYSYRLGLERWAAPLMIFIYPATWPIIIYRFGNWGFEECNIFFVRELLFITYFILKRITEILTGIEIAHDAQIGKGLFIGHLGGVIIGTKAIIGIHSSFHEGVTIGGADRGKNHGSPTIGNFCYFGAGAKVLGKIEIGDCVVIGANAVVVDNAPDKSVIVGVPGKVIGYGGSLDFIHFRKEIIDE